MTADEFKQARKTLQLSQVAMAAQLGMDRSTVQRYEYGELTIPRHVELAIRYMLLC